MEMIKILLERRIAKIDPWRYNFLMVQEKRYT